MGQNLSIQNWGTVAVLRKEKDAIRFFKVESRCHPYFKKFSVSCKQFLI
jgi:hypothetical protein